MVDKNTQIWQLGYCVLAWVMLPIALSMIRLVGLQKIFLQFSKDPFNEYPESLSINIKESYIVADKIQKSVIRAGRFWPDRRNNCLQRASVACLLIRSRKIPCKIKVGVKASTSQPGGYAHAWIEVLGHPIGESKRSLKDYVPFILNAESNV